MEMNRGEYRRLAKQRRIDARKNDMYKNENERSLDQEEEFTVDKSTGNIRSVMETYKRGVEYPKEIQEVSTFWSSLFYNNKDEKGNSATQEQILFELSEDGVAQDYSRNGSFSFSNLKKQYQVLVFDSYYAYKSGKKITPELESDTMLDVMVEAEIIKTPKQKEEMKALDSTVKCWSCDDPNQKIVSVEHAFPCSKCGELLWTGEGGFEKVGDIYK